MPNRRRILWRTMVGVVLVGALALTSLTVAYWKWRSTTLARLASGSALTATSHGPVEYALVGGREDPATSHLLVLHGTPGGYDAGLILVDWLEPDPTMRCIVPSRPGYLRTPLESGMTPAAAADAMAALLDRLGVGSTSVLGWSGGGPTAIELVQRHPGRVERLVLLSARVRGDDKYRFTEPTAHPDPFDPAAISVSRGVWGADFERYVKILGFRLMPGFVLARWFPDEVRSLGVTLDRLRQMSTTTQLPSRRSLGRHNDAWQFASLPRDPVITVTTPTLVVHSPIDASVGFEHATHAVREIPGSELEVVDRESHFSTLTPAAAERIRAFLSQKVG